MASSSAQAKEGEDSHGRNPEETDHPQENQRDCIGTEGDCPQTKTRGIQSDRNWNFARRNRTARAQILGRTRRTARSRRGRLAACGAGTARQGIVRNISSKAFLMATFCPSFLLA